MRVILAILLFPVLVLGQTQANQNGGGAYDFLNRYLQAESIAPSTQRFTKFVDRMADKSRNHNNQQLLLRQLFVKTHSRFLKNFRQSAKFSEMFSNGNYNCLTATALLGVALQRLGYQYSIFETTYHIFILVDTDRGQVLLETTDPFNGFISNMEAIDEKIQKYSAAKVASLNTQVIQYQFKSELYNTVTLENLTGLLHYNLSVTAVNNKQFDLATQHLEQANRYYKSSRIVELSEVIFLSLQAQEGYDFAALEQRLLRVKRISASATGKKL